MDEVKQEIPIPSIFFRPWEHIQSIANTSIGREHELERLQGEFENINRRLVVIEGVAGVGKTSLAAQLAMKVSKHYKVLWIDCFRIPVTAERIFREMGRFASEEYQYPKLSALVKNSALSKAERATELIEFLASLGKSSSNSASEDGLKPVALFFDRYDLVKDPALDQLINKIVECHIDVKVVLLIRQRFSFSQEIQTALNAASTLRLGGLSLEDCRTLLERYATRYPAIANLDDEMLYRIWIITDEGVPAALQILISITRKLSLTAALEYLPDYNTNIRQQWFERIFSEFSPDEIQVAIAASIFSQPFSRDILKYVSQYTTIDEIIDKLVDRFVLTFDGQTYSLHSLWSDYLGKLISIEKAKELHARAATFYLELESEDKHTLTQALLASWYHLIKAGDKDRILGKLPLISTALQDWILSMETIDSLEGNQTSSFLFTQQGEQIIKDDDGKQQQIDKNNMFVYGQVQGLIQGEYNTITLNFQNDKERSVPFLAPPQSSYDLVGRDKIMQEIKQQLLSGKNLALSALNGLPGVGKTALALALAYDHEVLGYCCDGVLWVGLGREPDIPSHLEAWGLALGISQSEMEKLTNATKLIQAIHRNIGTSRMLLVIDDAWSLEAALAFKLGGPNCVHLLTTRFPAVAEAFAGHRSVVVRELGEDDGLTLLEKLAPELAKIAPEEMRVLVHAVGGLPLPLTLMGNFLRIQMHTRQPRRIRTALDRLQQMKERLELSYPQAGLERHPSLPHGVPLSQLAVIKISDEALDEEARQTFHALSVFPSKPNTFSEEAALAIAAKSTKAIDTLEDFGLLESSGRGRYTLHQTISDYAKIELTDSTVYEQMVKFFLRFVENHKTDGSLLERELNNILAAVKIVYERGMYHHIDVSLFADFVYILIRAKTFLVTDQELS